MPAGTGSKDTNLFEGEAALATLRAFGRRLAGSYLNAGPVTSIRSSGFTAI